MNYQQAIEFIHSTSSLGKKFGLTNMKKLASLLGNPQDSFKIIHIAGTNGKGSTSNLIHDVLMSQGYKTGLFISPYLEKFTERIQVNKNHIDENSLVRLTSLIKEKINIMLSEGYNHPTEFEVITAIGFKYFQEQNIDFLVLEVGLGGKLDSTNIIKNPLVSVITSISYDHMELLGDTLEKIAFEKAGIIKENSHVVVYPQKDSITNVIKEYALSKNSQVHLVNEQNIQLLESNLSGQWFSYKDNDIFNLDNLKINLLGHHQLKNALTALKTLEVLKSLGFEITEKSIKNGFANCHFTGRFEVLSNSPLIIIDGAHNIDGIKTFTKAIKQYLDDKKIILFLGMLKDKHPEHIIEHILPICKKIYTITPNNPRALDAVDLKEIINLTLNNKNIIEISVDSISNYQEIITIINENKTENFSFVGSLYMIGDVRTLLNKYITI